MALEQQRMTNELRKKVAELEHALAKEAMADRMTALKKSMRT